MDYLERDLFEEIKKWVRRREIIAIKGPRQSGKTTLLEMLKEWLLEEGVGEEDITFLTFEDREVLEGFALDPKGLVKRFASGGQRHYILIDEAHYCPDIGQKLKLLYDTLRDVKFIITGSSSLEMTSQTAAFLVGRLFSFELFPFNFHEFLNARDRGLARVYAEKNKEVRAFIHHGTDFRINGRDIFIRELLEHLGDYLVFGGYPEVVKAEDEEEKRIILKNIFNTYIDRDIVSHLHITDTIKFRKLVSLLSLSCGNLISYEKLAAGCGSYFREVLGLLDVLGQTYVIELLRPFHRNLVTELRKNPKVYFLDPGLRNYAIKNFNPPDLRDDAGRLAENFVFNQLRREEVPINFWRTTAKAEVDFVLRGEELVPIEVKFEAMKRPALSRSFHSFLKNYEPDRALVVTRDLWAEGQYGKTKVKFVPIVYL
jgi:predicted AAA+ superfamily ATPase